MSLSGKVALVTGASRGIGKAIAIALAEHGAKVYGTATSEKGVETFEQAMKKAGFNGVGKILNICDADQIDAVVAEIKSENENNRIDILVNNAAVTADNLFIRMKDDEWHKVIETNLNSVFKLTKACTRDMMKARWGRVINISSIVGVTGNAGQPNYSAAKAGIIGFSKSVAQELASRGVTVNCVAPGFIDTDMTRALNEKQHEAIMRAIPMKRMGEPEEIASAVAFLASQAAAYITGQTLHVNGGMLMI